MNVTKTKNLQMNPLLLWDLEGPKDTEKEIKTCSNKQEVQYKAVDWLTGGPGGPMGPSGPVGPEIPWRRDSYKTLTGIIKISGFSRFNKYTKSSLNKRVSIKIPLTGGGLFQPYIVSFRTSWPWGAGKTSVTLLSLFTWGSNKTDKTRMALWGKNKVREHHWSTGKWHSNWNLLPR